MTMDKIYRGNGGDFKYKVLWSDEKGVLLERIDPDPGGGSVGYRSHWTHAGLDQFFEEVVPPVVCDRWAYVVKHRDSGDVYIFLSDNEHAIWMLYDVLHKVHIHYDSSNTEHGPITVKQ
jgi:hypothetical protein